MSDALQKIAKLEEMRVPMLNTADLTDAMGQKNNMASYIQSRVPEAPKMVGTAYTVRAVPGDFLTVMKAVNELSDDDVMVVDGGGYTETAIIGELVCGKGRGIVLDGAARDLGAIREMRYPLFTKAIVPRAGKAATMGEVQIPVSCGGCLVRPGDIVVGDDDGACVVPADRVDEVLEKIRAIEDREHRVKVGGEDLNTVYGIADLLEKAPAKPW